MQEFKDKVAVVTGAASGIGLATASLFAREGMKVVMADIQEDALADAVAVLSYEGLEVTAVPTDVTCKEQIEALASATLDAYGAVHVVHNNAGVVRAGTLEELTVADWEWVLAVDLWSVIYGVRTFLPLVKQAGEGHFINTASSAGLQATVNIGPYNVAKSGVVSLTETLRLELEEAGSAVGASVLCPGAVSTRICESGRTRDAAGFGADDESATDAHFREMAGAIVSEGMSTTEVADKVLAAIKSNDFWIITHSDWKTVMQERVAGMQDNRLVTGFGG